MKMLFKILLAVPASLLCVVLSSAFPTGEFEEHIQRLVRSDEIEGYDFATLHAVDSSTNKEVRQTKRDIKTHATDLSSTKRSFSLQLTSGERLRMRLDRRSIDTSGARFSALTENGEKEIGLRSTDCFFSGHLQGEEEGFASLTMCDGELMGSVTTAKRQYAIHTLRPTGHGDTKRDTTEEEDDEDDVHVLVTWQSNERKTRGLHDGLDIPSHLISMVDHNERWREAKRSLEIRKATIEIGEYVDRFFIRNVDKKLGIATDEDIIKLLINKWSAVTNLLSNPTLTGWDITLRLVNVVIMRNDPEWYKPSPSDDIKVRLERICNGTKSEKYDHISLHTGRTSDPEYLGKAWIGGLCDPQWRCSAMISSNQDFWTELHELGHSLGLDHDEDATVCQRDKDKQEGFMAANRDHLRLCYRKMLLKQLKKPGSDCVFTDSYSKYEKEFHNDQ